MRHLWLSLVLLTACDVPTDMESQPERMKAAGPIVGAALNCGTAPTPCRSMPAQPYVDDMNHRRLLYTCVAWLIACAPFPTPDQPPTPVPAAGGVPGTGGAPATGGRAASGGTPATGGSAASPEAAACTNLMFLGCPEGNIIDCESTMKLRCGNRKVKCATACLADAKTKAEVQTKCGLTCGGL
jgi:hypothetical protein